MSSYQIEMLWTCSICKKDGNKGLSDRYCGNCGHKKDNSDSEYFPEDISENNALTGDLQKKAVAGTDWVCMFCDSLQNQLNKCCSNCGATERGTKKFVPPAQTVIETSSGVREYNSDVPVTGSIQLMENLPEKPFINRPRYNKNLLFLLVPIIIGLILWLIFRTKEVDAKVNSTFWEHRVLIDRYQVLQREGWYAEPRSFNVLPIGRRHHHDERVHVGSHQESYQDSYACGQNCTTSPRTRSCSSNGNGSANCSYSGGNTTCSTKYCSRTAYRTVQDYRNEPRYQIWYSWNIWDWAYNRTIKHAGTIDRPTWPTSAELDPNRLSDGEQERSSRERNYKVIFRDEDDNYKIEPQTLDEFLKYKIGDTYKLEVSIASVSVIKQL